MDKRLARIFELVFLLNQKGEDLQVWLAKNSICVLDANCGNITPHWTGNIYLGEYWKNDYAEMVKGTLELLETMLEEAI